MKTRNHPSNKIQNTTIKRRPLRKFAAAALLAGSLMGCAASGHEVRPQAAQCALEQGLRAGQNAYVVLLSDGQERINGALRLKISKVDSKGADFDFTLLFDGQAHDLKLRANFDGTRGGDLRVLSFFGGDEFSVSPHCGGIKVSYRETIISGLAAFQNSEPSGSCPAKMPRGTVCT